MSFWKKLFGGGGDVGSAAPDEPVQIAEHKGFTIEARPYKESGQFQVAGVIAKGEGEARKEHKFIRADRFPSVEEAADFALMKGRQIVDQQGDRVFD
jgi:hypothetical protein